MRRWLLALPCLLLLGAVLGAPSSSVGQAGGSAVSGSWRYRGAPEEGTTIVRNAVEPVLMRMRPDIQAVARERVAESTWLPTRIRIGANRSRVQVALQGQERRTFASAVGRPIQVPMRSGQYAQLTQQLLPGGGLEQQFVALDGVQTNRYLPGPNGTMLLDVTMTSSMLPSDIRFQLEYVRGR
jgi:hypothetical protein